MGALIRSAFARRFLGGFALGFVALVALQPERAAQAAADWTAPAPHAA